MSKIQISNLNDLINNNYPISYIEKIINDVLILSILVKNEYPNYKEWFLTKQVPGIYDGSRNIIIAHIDNKIVGFVSLKKDHAEKKICTFYVEKKFNRNKIGTILTRKAIDWLECEKPLITIPNNKLGEFIRISKKYDWQVTDIKENLYRINNPEIILNGSLIEQNQNKIEEKIKTKSLSRIWFFYLFNKSINIFTFKRKIIN